MRIFITRTFQKILLWW